LTFHTSGIADNNCLKPVFPSYIRGTYHLFNTLLSIRIWGITPVERVTEDRVSGLETGVGNIVVATFPFLILIVKYFYPKSINAKSVTHVSIVGLRSPRRRRHPLGCLGASCGRRADTATAQGIGGVRSSHAAGGAGARKRGAPESPVFCGAKNAPK
jgi:hypothetical protein